MSTWMLHPTNFNERRSSSRDWKVACIPTNLICCRKTNIRCTEFKLNQFLLLIKLEVELLEARYPVNLDVLSLNGYWWSTKILLVIEFFQEKRIQLWKSNFWDALGYPWKQVGFYLFNARIYVCCDSNLTLPNRSNPLNAILCTFWKIIYSSCYFKYTLVKM
jgi:hypothetical protein